MMLKITPSPLLFETEIAFSIQTSCLRLCRLSLMVLALSVLSLCGKLLIATSSKSSTPPNGQVNDMPNLQDDFDVLGLSTHISL